MGKTGGNVMGASGGHLRQCHIQIRWALKLAFLITLAMVTSTRRRNFLRKNGRSWAILLSLTSLLVGIARTFRIPISSSAVSLRRLRKLSLKFKPLSEHSAWQIWLLFK